ncbi:uncharacterized protein LOC126743642 [Anthonomus grandis grandis]|uniref:uncharacterized protein LOC126743642 n=1 Tax=Anthonomus grandis grandis TaxID=2921223 RepID=UPI0021651D61|nr:uncharacterized protein LOC126743642 [Anthonomus grandis grandis]
MHKELLIILLISSKLVIIHNLLIDCNKYSTTSRLQYYKIKSCHKSSASVIFWKRVTNLQECKEVARERGGMAFNFSPAEAQNLSKFYMPNCHVLACPQIGNDSTLTMDLAYDYYSAYGNWNVTQNATCIKAIGLFTLNADNQNYSQNILTCQSNSGDLADVTSEYRSTMLAQMLNTSITDWHKLAYVGLNDLFIEGAFTNSFGKPLVCSNYRAWAPGHPRSKHESEDCVTLDSEKLWRVVRCNKVKLRGVCEVYPHKPPRNIEGVPQNVSCGGISRRQYAKIKRCLEEKMIFRIYQNATRIDKCGLVNFIY